MAPEGPISGDFSVRVPSVARRQLDDGFDRRPDYNFVLATI